MYRRQGGRLTKRQWRRAFVNGFILWHLFALAIWLLPSSSMIARSCIPLVQPYMTFTGFAQNWRMFSPNPDKTDLFVEARITYADGAVRSWTYPRMAAMGYGERYGRERFRKFVEVSHLDMNQVLWPSLARYAARRNHTDPRNPPTTVTLVRHHRIIPPPGMSPPPYQTYAFFTMPVSARDLR